MGNEATQALYERLQMARALLQRSRAPLGAIRTLGILADAGLPDDIDAYLNHAPAAVGETGQEKP